MVRVEDVKYNRLKQIGTLPVTPPTPCEKLIFFQDEGIKESARREEEVDNKGRRQSDDAE